MRCVAIRERFRSKFDTFTRSYSKSDTNHTEHVPPEVIGTSMQTKETHLVQRIFNYLKTWRAQHQELIRKLNGKLFMQSFLTKLATIRDVPKASLGFPLLKNQNLDKIPTIPQISQDSQKAVDKVQAKSSVRVCQEPKSRKLMKYPVIPLTETINRYLISIRPFFDRSEFRRERKIAMKFMRSEGHKLQMLLEDAGRFDSNWLTDRWTKATYLQHRSPVTAFSSPCISFPIQDFCDPLDYVDFAAKAIYRMCEFKKLIELDCIPVHRIEEYQLDNSQFHNVYGTVRMPKPLKDVLKQFNSNYIVVIHKNNFYKLHVYNKLGYPIRTGPLTKALLTIVNSGHCKGPEIGLLSHDTRDNWAEAYTKLCHQKVNRNSIKSIEAALFTVSLDEHVMVPKCHKRSVLAQQLLYGGGLDANSANRWMDKTLQLIVNPNGMVGLCYEQAPADPQPAAMIMDYVQSNINKPEIGIFRSFLNHDECKLEHLKFLEICDCIELWLSTAKRNISKIHELLKIHAFKFSLYGWALIKGYDLSPDGFIQMALQLAFYRLHKQLPVQQETAHLRIFKFGRTESIRCTSAASWTFVVTMMSKWSTPSVRFLALRNALAFHQRQTRQALRGRGIDGHLFGLEQMALENDRPLPDFFYSKGYLQSRNFRIISSQASTLHDAFMAYGPYTAEGYSCSYNPREEDIIFAVSSWNWSGNVCAERFGNALEQVLVDMGELIVENEAGMYGEI